jgi:membrane-associated HD superfamily phosphohydrolase
MKERRDRILEEGFNILQEVCEEGIFEPIHDISGDEASTVFFKIQIEGQHKDIQPRSEKDALRYLSMNLTTLDLDWPLARAFYRLLKAGIGPNLIYNSEKSEEKIKAILQRMPKIMVNVKKGDVIVESGSFVGAEQTEKLYNYHI